MKRFPVLRKKPSHILPKYLLKEAAIHFLSSQLITLLNYETLLGLLNFHWLRKHIKKIRSSHRGSEVMPQENFSADAYKIEEN